VGPKRSTRILFGAIPASVSSPVAASAKPGVPHTYAVASGVMGAGRSPPLSRPTGRGHDGGAARVVDDRGLGTRELTCVVEVARAPGRHDESHQVRSAGPAGQPEHGHERHDAGPAADEEGRGVTPPDEPAPDWPPHLEGVARHDHLVQEAGDLSVREELHGQLDLGRPVGRAGDRIGARSRVPVGGGQANNVVLPGEMD